MKKVLNFLDQNCEVILMYLAAVALIASVILQVLSRAAMMPISWTEEVARYSFVWLTFFGVGYGIRNESHTRFELFDGLLSKTIKRILKVFYSLLGLAVWGLIFVVCFDFVSFTAQNRAPALNVTILVRNLSILIGAAITLIRLLQRLILDVMALAKKEAV